MKVTNIKWDADYPELLYLPGEVEIPEEIGDDTDAISEYLSNLTGYCHYGFCIDGEKKEINRVAITIEHYNGNSYLSFMLSVKEDGSVEIINEKDCSVADVDGDYIYGSDNDLIRIQADEPISHFTFNEIMECYHEHNEAEPKIKEEVLEYISNHNDNPMDYMYAIMHQAELTKEEALAYLEEAFIAKYSEAELENVLENYFAENRQSDMSSIENAVEV